MQTNLNHYITAVLAAFSKYPTIKYLLITIILFGLAALFLTKEKRPIHHSHDLTAIAGDNLAATLLDLAKAYIEMGDLKLAKKLLKQTLKHGSPTQKQEAKHLMKTL